MHLETSRLIIRDFDYDDFDALWAIFGDAETMRHVEPFTQEKARDFLRSFCIEREPRGAYAAVLKDTSHLIGYLLFTHKGQPEIYEVGFIFNRQYWRRGFAYEAVDALFDYGFRVLGVHKIFAQTDDPVSSLGLMLKLGMKIEGVLREEAKQPDGSWKDMYVCGILRKDYRSRMASPPA